MDKVAGNAVQPRATLVNSNFEKLLDLLSIHNSDKVILIKESNSADSNFVLTHFMRKTLEDDSNRICFVLMHNTIGHYQNVQKKLGMDLINKVDSGHVSVLDLLTSVFNNLIFSRRKYTDRINEDFIKYIYKDIENKIQLLKDTPGADKVIIVIEDISKLLDLGLDLPSCNIFLQYLINLAHVNDYIKIIINTHIGDNNDEIFSNAIEYAADITIGVNALKTGRSSDVTGILKIKRHDENFEELTYHYKAMDKTVKSFRPGEIMF